MILLNYIHRKCTGSNKFTTSKEKFSHFMYMNNTKLFTKREKELGTLIQTIRIFMLDIAMEFVILIMKSRKKQIMQGLELLNQKKIRRFE